MLLSGGMYYFVPGEGGEGRRGEAHHDVGQRHVAHEQVHARVQTRAPANTHSLLLELQTIHRAFSWSKAPTSAITFKNLLRHYAKQALTPL